MIVLAEKSGGPIKSILFYIPFVGTSLGRFLPREPCNTRSWVKTVPYIRRKGHRFPPGY
jgi:hypothetical protein